MNGDQSNQIPDWILREIDKLLIHGFGELVLTFHDHKITKLRSATYRCVQAPKASKTDTG